MFVMSQMWGKEILESRSRFEPFTNLVPRVYPGNEVDPSPHRYWSGL